MQYIHHRNAAFPGPYDGRYGMDLRTYLAAMSMQGMLANPAIFETMKHPDADADFLSRAAVEQADSLIAELNKPTP